MRRVALKGLAARKLRLILTALAIVLGITFVTGTLVLSDTLNRTFDTLVDTAYEHVSFEVRGDATLKGPSIGIDSTANRRAVPESIVAAIRRIPGVEVAFGSVSGYAQFVAHDGNAIGGARRSAGFSFDPYRKLSTLQLAAGRAPRTGTQVLMDKATAAKYHFKIGDRVRILLPGKPRTFTISGLIKFGGANNLAGVSLAAFSLPTAQRLFNSVGKYAAINILTAHGADNVRIEREIAAVLPKGVQVVTGQQVANDLDQSISNSLSFLSNALLIFGLIALIVGGFTIYNTFSITVGQRTRELALLRILGASRRQLFAAVLNEAAITGLIGSLIGIGLGVLAAAGLRALLSAFGISLPSSPLVFETRTPIVAIVLGVGVTVLSSVIPARRAVRIAPVAALGDHDAYGAERVPRVRLAGGAALLAAAVALLTAGVTGDTPGLVGLGAAALFIAAGMLLPALSRPVASLLGRPLASVLRVPGRLGRENSIRNPRRTAQTAAALMLGIGLVSMIAVLGGSLSASARQNVDRALAADYLVGGSGSVSRLVAPTVARLPGVTATTEVYRGQFEFRGALSGLGAVSLPGLSQDVDLHLVAGRRTALRAGEILVDTNTANADHLHVGSRATVTFAQTGRATITVGGIFEPNPLIGSYVVSAPFFRSHFNQPLVDAVLISAKPASGAFERKLKRVLRAYANLSIQSRGQYERSQQQSISQLLDLVYVLLALAVAIALIGIVNTLMLSVFERTHEIGLLRAVGMGRRQVRAMIRAAAVIIALFGTLLGIILGGGLGVAFAGSLRNSNVTVVSIPAGHLLVFLIISTVLGLLAASWPARRAAKLDVLNAIATE